MKPIKLSCHAEFQMTRRGTCLNEIKTAIENTEWHLLEGNRLECRFSFDYNDYWNGKYYKIKQVRPIFVDEETIVVVTVYTYFF